MILLWSLFLLLITGCATNPVTGKTELHLISESQEIKMGEQVYGYLQQMQGGDYVTDLRLPHYVSKIGMKLAEVSDRPHLPYQFAVLDNPIPNAWSLPGGKIGINRGLLILLDSEAELAAVLAHEIVHSAARHSAKGAEKAMLLSLGMAGLCALSKNKKYEDLLIGGATFGAELLVLHYSRSAEYEADHYGIEYMVRAGYDPYAAVTLQEKFLKLSEEDMTPTPTIYSTHPSSEDRIKENKKIASQYPDKGKKGKGEYELATKQLKKDAPAYKKLDEGYEAFIKKRYEEALTLAQEGIHIEPREPHLWNLKGKCELQRGNLHLAHKAFDEAITINPNYFDFYFQRGVVEYKEGDFESAYKDFAKSYLLLPTDEAKSALEQTKPKRSK